MLVVSFLLKEVKFHLIGGSNLKLIISGGSRPFLDQSYNLIAG